MPQDTTQPPSNEPVSRFHALEHSFGYHKPPDAFSVCRLDDIRLVFLNLAKTVVDVCPAGRERALAITKLEEACMWAIKSVALSFPTET